MGLKNLDVTMMLAKSPCPNITQHFLFFVRQNTTDMWKEIAKNSTKLGMA